ncbi:MAG: glutathione S-transferase family protein [Maricaulaceae bacterium]
MLTLYDYEAAPSPRRARIFLAEKGIQHNNVQVDLKTQEQLGDAFRKINPRCAVPCIVTEDGQAISENIAIAIFAETIRPEPPLMGTNAVEKARILEWNWRCEFEGLAAVAEILRNSSPHMKGRAMTGPRNVEQVPALAERGRERLGHFFEDLDARLAASANVAGEDYSLADITAMVVVDFSKWVKAQPSESLTHLWAWHAKAAARPASSA